MTLRYPRRSWPAFVVTVALYAQPQPTLTVEPVESLYDEPVTIRVTGVQPDRAFVLRASTTVGENRTLLSEIPFRSKRDGTFDFSKTGSVVESMKPFWSIRLASPPPPRPPSLPDEWIFRLEVLDGERTVASA